MTVEYQNYFGNKLSFTSTYGEANRQKDQMRLQSGITTVSMGHLIWNTLKLKMMHLSGK
jgi:hypothetical protein